MQRSKFKVPQKIKVHESRGRGRGVFATAMIRRGEIIEAAPAVVIPAKSRSALEETVLRHYMFQTDDGRHYVVGMGYVAIINHSDDPNATFDVTTEVVVIRAIKTIPAGKELTIDYGWDEDHWSEIGGQKDR